MKKIHGPITALITPMRNGELDISAFERLVDWQIREGIAGIVPCGTTGESATITFDETRLLFRAAISVAKGRVPVIAGAGSNSTREAIELSRIAQEEGADALLQVVPYYNKPTQDDMVAHFTAIHDATELPIILYNVPGRTVVSMSIETQTTLSKLPRVIGMKDATGDLSRVPATIAASGADFLQLTGEDANVLEFLQRGGHGCISVTSNVAPRLCADLYAAVMSGNLAEAAQIDARLQPLHAAMFVQSSPGPVKYAASRMGLCEPDMRLPLTRIADASKAAVDRALDTLRPAMPRLAAA